MISVQNDGRLSAGLARWATVGVVLLLAAGPAIANPRAGNQAPLARASTPVTTHTQANGPRMNAQATQAPRAAAPMPAPAQAAAGAVGGFDLRTAQTRAVQQILVSFRSSNPFIRANAIEAAEALPRRVGPLAQHALLDPHPAVRFAALSVIGKLKLTEVAPGARALLNDPDDSVRGAAVFALAACFGTDARRHPQAVDMSPMASLMGSNDPTVRGNMAMLLGLLGDRSAVPLMKDMARVPLYRVSREKATLVNLQVAEAVVKLGDEDSIDAIRSGTFSQFDEVRVLSVLILGRLNDRRFEAAITEMLRQPPVELQLASAATLARLGRADGLNFAVSSAKHQSELVRVQSAITLGIFRNNAQAMQTLYAMLMNDSSEQVRIAASAGLLGGGRDGL